MDEFTTDVTFDAPGGWPFAELVPGSVSASTPMPGDGWHPPATIGGTWCRESPEGVFEFWPRPTTQVEIVHSDSLTYLKDPAAFQKPTMPLGYSQAIKALLGTTTTLAE